jgi:uncharacterized membrane protein YgcG
MRPYRRWSAWLCALALMTLAASTASASLPASPPSSWIHDGASLLTAPELAEIGRLRVKLEQQTGARLVVLTLSSADGEESKSIAVRALNEWNAGRRSALLLVLLSPRQLYIQPGTDLANVLDPATATTICSEIVGPKLRSGDRAAAIRAGLEAIATQIGSAGRGQGASAASAASAAGLRPFSDADEVAVVSPPRSEGSWLWLLWAGGLVVLAGGVWGVRMLLARKCQECGTRMTKTSEVTMPSTYSAAGEGRHHFMCPSCGRSYSELYFIAQLTTSTDSTTSSYDSSTTTSSWSSDSSSWSSSSSDSSSSSSSSSDGSGGGGSNW